MTLTWRARWRWALRLSPLPLLLSSPRLPPLVSQASRSDPEIEYTSLIAKVGLRDSDRLKSPFLIKITQHLKQFLAEKRGPKRTRQNQIIAIAHLHLGSEKSQLQPPIQRKEFSKEVHQEGQKKKGASCWASCDRTSR